ncbi:MAG: orotidine 5-phosphate decarboxylase [Desulfomicrobiaceae bacterium]|jgi:orotidine-5'-phosphate decarboxylase|nr:orotidine 5-phosphate decarboxylase [Desulfomicrobiaceae bacterium]
MAAHDLERMGAGMSPQLVVALDFPQAKSALTLAQQLVGVTSWVKVGLELYLAAGARIVADLKGLGFRVFVDLKFLDIPNTVAGAVRQACGSGADMLTVHALGGKAMVQAALAARDAAGTKTHVVAVTLLTHLGPADLPWAMMPLPELAGDLARQAHAWGADGVVCSGQEAESIRAATSPDFLLVTPGLRRPEDHVGDQTRICTPQAAARAGSNFLVMGRPITGATDPAAAARQILASVLTPGGTS